MTLIKFYLDKYHLKKKKIQSFVGFHEQNLDFKNNNISESKAFISETQKENYFNIMIIKCEIIHFIQLCNCMDYISCTIVWIIIVIINVFALQLLLSGLDRWGINWRSMAHWSFRY